MVIVWKPVQAAQNSDHPGYLKESAEPFGYTLFVHLQGDKQLMGATWRGKPDGPPIVCKSILARRDTPEVKQAAQHLLAACEAHWEKIRPKAG